MPRTSSRSSFLLFSPFFLFARTGIESSVCQRRNQPLLLARAGLPQRVYLDRNPEYADEPRCSRILGTRRIHIASLAKCDVHRFGACSVS